MKNIGNIKGVNIYSDLNVPEDKIVVTYSNEQRKDHILALSKILHKHFQAQRQATIEGFSGCQSELADYIKQATKIAEVRGKLWGIDLAFDSHDYDRIREMKTELQAQLQKDSKDEY